MDPAAAGPKKAGRRTSATPKAGACGCAVWSRRVGAGDGRQGDRRSTRPDPEVALEHTQAPRGVASGDGATRTARSSKRGARMAERRFRDTVERWAIVAGARRGGSPTNALPRGGARTRGGGGERGRGGARGGGGGPPPPPRPLPLPFTPPGSETSARA